MASFKVSALCAGFAAATLAVATADSECEVREDGQVCTRPPTSGSVMLQVQSSKTLTVAEADAEVACTGIGSDPYSAGSMVECCAGAKQELGEHSPGNWHYNCVADEPCTSFNEDPWASGSFVACCAGSQHNLVESSGRQHYKCQAATPASDDVNGASQGETTSKIMEWNVFYQNRDYRGMAGIVTQNNVDIVGFCELTGSMHPMTKALSDVSGRDWRVQPGREGWKGFGTDVFYDNGKWELVEGGVSTASCGGSRGGQRAINWVVLKDRQTGGKITVGGTHISYCAEGCDEVHFCELGQMYEKLESMRVKHDAPVIWMGDMNRHMNTHVMQSVLKGQIGGKRTFAVDDLVKTNTNTYYSGGPAIDHILGDAGKFIIQEGGRTSQGVRGQKLYGADHFPIYALVRMAK